MARGEGAGEGEGRGGGEGVPFVSVDDEAFLLETGDDAVDGGVEALSVDVRLLAPRCDQRRLVAHVGHLGAREARRERRELLGVLVGVAVAEGERLEVHAKDLGATLDVGPVDDHLPVEAARAQQRRVEDVGAVGACVRVGVRVRVRVKGRTESRRWVRLVPARTTTPDEEEKPSISMSSWLSVFSRSSLPPPKPPLPRARPTASISSMKIRHGALARA